MKCAAYNLNCGADNAISEALALAYLYHSGPVLPERDLLRCAGFGFDIPGTPDGAIVLCNGRMAAVQVVRASTPRGNDGIGTILSVFIAKVYKSLKWLTLSGLGDGIVMFTIALWIPRRLSAKAFSSLRNKFSKYAHAIDTRFNFVLLVPPCSEFRSIIFPPKFGVHLGNDHDCDNMMDDIHGLSNDWNRLEEERDDECALGFLEDVF